LLSINIRRCLLNGLKKYILSLPAILYLNTLKSLDSANLNRLKDFIGRSENILITTHHNPDGDAIGSTIGLGLSLIKIGKKINIVTPNEYPHFLKWMKGTNLITLFNRNEKAVEKIAREADLIFCVDYNEPSRLKKAAELVLRSNAAKVLIDHHPDPADFTDLIFSETELGSASELVYHILQGLGLGDHIDIDIASALYAGIMTDTGCFSFSCSYPGVFQVVAELIHHKIPKEEIHSLIYDNYSENRMQLMGYCLNKKMVVLPEFSTAYISLSDAELKKFRHVPGDTEGFVNLPFSIKGIKLTALFIEKKDYVKISLRSRGDFSVTDFARKNFRGGGHINAAGAEWDLPLENTIQRFINSLPLYADKLK
jgi:phosphoesterase RecJ-like protein